MQLARWYSWDEMRDHLSSAALAKEEIAKAVVALDEIVAMTTAQRVMAQRIERLGGIDQ
jgi:hypothetical protein